LPRRKTVVIRRSRFDLACAGQITTPASHTSSKVRQSQLKGRHFSFLKNSSSIPHATKFFNNISSFLLTSKWIFKVLNRINVNKTYIFSIFTIFLSFLLFLPYLFVNFIICTFVLTLSPSWPRQLKFFVQLLNWTRLSNVLRKINLLSSSRVNFK